MTFNLNCFKTTLKPWHTSSLTTNHPRTTEDSTTAIVQVHQLLKHDIDQHLTNFPHIIRRTRTTNAITSRQTIPPFRLRRVHRPLSRTSIMDSNRTTSSSSQQNRHQWDSTITSPPDDNELIQHIKQLEHSIAILEQQLTNFRFLHLYLLRANFAKLSQLIQPQTPEYDQPRHIGKGLQRTPSSSRLSPPLPSHYSKLSISDNQIV